MQPQGPCLRVLTDAEVVEHLWEGPRAIAHRLLRGCVAALAPAPLAKRFAAADDLREAVAKVGGELPQGLAAMAAHVLQPAADGAVSVEGRVVHTSPCCAWLLCFAACSSPVRMPPAHTPPAHITNSLNSQGARAKLSELYRQVRALDLASDGGLTGGWAAEERCSVGGMQLQSLRLLSLASCTPPTAFLPINLCSHGGPAAALLVHAALVHLR